jgi:hypothetical protein
MWNTNSVLRMQQETDKYETIIASSFPFLINFSKKGEIVLVN